MLETRSKLMLCGGQFSVADDPIWKAIFIRTSISGEDHHASVSARETDLFRAIFCCKSYKRLEFLGFVIIIIL